MKKIFQVAKREVGRFRGRFSGGSRIVMFALIAISLLVSYFIAQQGLVIGKGIYTVGESPDGPSIGDGRFNVLVTDHATGMRMLNAGSIDLYMDGEKEYARNDSRSQYAAGALKQYLEKAETSRLIEQYVTELNDTNRSFPLRIQVGYLYGAQSPQGTATPAASVNPATTGAPPATDTSAAVEKQIEELRNGSSEKLKPEFVSDREVVVPSLMNPPVPLFSVVLAFLYIVPMLFMGIFFNSSFMDEKINRKLNVLMSTPLTPLDVIAGKMLPYVVFSLAIVVVMTLVTGGNVLLSLAIFLPVILFIFAIYLMVALVYRTFKDQTFFSMAAMTFVTGYMVLPALLAGINNVSYISPLTLAVQMYDGKSFGLVEYAISTVPMYLVFGLSLFVGVRIFNEEYQMSYGPLYRKAADAIYLTINKNHAYASIALLSLLLIPIVFMIQMIILIISLMLIPPNSPPTISLAILLALCVIVEEVAKSAGIVTLMENKRISTAFTDSLLALISGRVKSLARPLENRKASLALTMLFLVFASALGFFIGEKLLLYLSLSIISNVMLIEALGGVGSLVVVLAVHFVFTSIVCLSTWKLGVKYYPLAIMVGSVAHVLYDLYVLSGAGV